MTTSFIIFILTDLAPDIFKFDISDVVDEYEVSKLTKSNLQKQHFQVWNITT